MENKKLASLRVKGMIKKTVTLEDHELVSSYIKGDESALIELIYRHQSKIFTSIFMMVKNRELAEDLFQETFIKIIETLKKGKYNEEGKFISWAIRISHNLVIDYFRKSKKATFISSTDDFDIFEVHVLDESNAEKALIQKEIYQKLYSSIQKLPHDQKEVLIMRHYAELSFKEIAQLTDVSINTALGRMRYALQNLKKMMGEDMHYLKTG